MKAGPTTMAGPAGEMWGALAAVAVLSLLMVVAMVQFSRAMLDAGIPADVRASRRKWWGLAYAALWVGIVGAFVVLLRHERGPNARKNWLLLTVMVVGWWGLHGLILWFGGALARASARDDVEAEARRALEPETLQDRPDETASDVADDSDDTGGRSTTAPGSAPAPPPDRWAMLRLIRNVVIVLFIVAVAAVIDPHRRIERWMNARRGVLLPAAIAVTAIGFALLLGGAIHMVLSRRGRRMTRQEFEAMQRRRQPGGPLLRRRAYRFRGTFEGRTAEDAATFGEMKQAWRDGSWRRSPRWRGLFAMSAGGLLMFFGGFSIPLVVAPIGIKLIVAGCMLYAAVRLVVGLRRAR
jgi:hypothetical protein